MESGNLYYLTYIYPYVMYILHAQNLFLTDNPSKADKCHNQSSLYDMRLINQSFKLLKCLKGFSEKVKNFLYI